MQVVFFSMVLMAAPLQALVGIMAVLCGVVMYGYYALEGCDPFRAGYIKNTNQVR